MIESETSQKVNNSLFFSDGCIAGTDAIVLTGHFNAYPDADVTRIAFRFGIDWTYSDCRSDLLRSVTFSSEHGKCFLAGRNGVIRSYGKSGMPFTMANVRGTMTEATLVDSRRFGEIFRIRAFADQVFCCGQSAQVYRLQEGLWVHSDEGILSPESQTLEDIHGTGPDNIYAVGMGGVILHFNGTRWQQLDSPTDQSLSGVRCVSKERVFICGNNGVLLEGNLRGWDLIDSNDFRMNYWDLEAIGDTLYLAHVRGIVSYHDGTFSEVRLPSPTKVSCNRLYSSGHQLLSVGVDDIWLFNGRAWEEILWPDNRKSPA